MTDLATCPVCEGTGHVTPFEWAPKRDHDRGWSECRNCGGQTMSQRGSGVVFKRPSTGLGCWHEYRGEHKGRCCTLYTCIHGCGASYIIDSGD